MILDGRDPQYGIKNVNWTVKVWYPVKVSFAISGWERTDSSKNIQWPFMVAGTIKDWKSAENKRLAQCVWCVRPYKLPDAYALLQKQNRKTVSGFYQQHGQKIQYRYKTNISSTG